MDRIQISIVTFNSEKTIEKCLHSLESGLDGLQYEVKILDNNSSDNTVELIDAKFPDIQMIKSQENLGFGKGHNQICQKTDCPYILVLNPDAVLQERAVSRLMLGLKSDARMALVGPRMEYEEGWPQISFGMFPGLIADIRQGKLVKSIQEKNPASIKKLKKLLKHDVTPGWVSGSCFLAKTGIMKNVGFFDEDFFLYLEDVDLCYRLRKKGYQVKVVSNARCSHSEGQSHVSDDSMKKYYRDSRLIYENKHGGYLKFLLYKLLKAGSSSVKFRKEIVWKA